MRLHTSFLETSDLYRAARTAGVSFTRLEGKGSRKRDAAFDFILTGSSPRRQNFGGDDYAATWDEWGIFLGVLFDLDPNAVVPGYYDGRDHYHWSTGHRFATDLPHAERHVQHNWDWAGEVATGSYSVHTCDCGATKRFMLRGLKFTDLG